MQIAGLALMNALAVTLLTLQRECVLILALKYLHFTVSCYLRGFASLIAHSAYIQIMQLVDVSKAVQMELMLITQPCDANLTALPIL